MSSFLTTNIILHAIMRRVLLKILHLSQSRMEAATWQALKNTLDRSKNSGLDHQLETIQKAERELRSSLPESEVGCTCTNHSLLSRKTKDFWQEVPACSEEVPQGNVLQIRVRTATYGIVVLVDLIDLLSSLWSFKTSKRKCKILMRKKKRFSGRTKRAIFKL